MPRHVFTVFAYVLLLTATVFLLFVCSSLRVAVAPRRSRAARRARQLTAPPQTATHARLLSSIILLFHFLFHFIVIVVIVRVIVIVVGCFGCDKIAGACAGRRGVGRRFDRGIVPSPYFVLFFIVAAFCVISIQLFLQLLYWCHHILL
jgi:hypothetical protein